MTTSALPTETTDLAGLLARQKAAATADMTPDRKTRDDRLRRLEAMVVAHRRRFAELISEDFGYRSAMVTEIGDVMAVRSAVRYARGHLRRWMRPRGIATSFAFMPARARVMSQPLGTVGIIGAWNYPLQLTLSPLVGALAAGNRAMLKPSELTPRFAEALKDAVARTFAAEEVAAVTGGPEIGAAFAALPFDHLVFTGSTRTGRLVAEAAARNLTPVTLELGGKSPVIVDASAEVAKTAERLAWGKLFNAGQTCIAPDYALVPRSLVEPLVEALHASVAKLYPTIAGNPDYTSIVNDHHFTRLRGLVEDARARGGHVVELSTEPGLSGVGRTLPPTLVLGATDAMAVMDEEIFGPILPIQAYDGLDEAIAMVNARPRPLALYWFGADKAARDRVLRATISGGVSINETMLHAVQEGLPFGGVGPSGTGQYHGSHGFRTFSKEKAVFHQSRLASTFLLNPPYNAFTRLVVRLLVAARLRHPPNGIGNLRIPSVAVFPALAT